MRRLLSPALCAALLLSSPGANGWLLFAQEQDSILTYDPQSQLIKRQIKYTANTGDLIHQLQTNQALRAQVPAASIDQAVGFLQRYQRDFDGDAASPEAKKALTDLVDELNSDKGDPNLALAHMYDHLQGFARDADASGMVYVPVLNAQGHQVIEARSSILMQTLFTQDQVELAAKRFRKTVLRDDPAHPGKKVIDVIFLEDDRDAAHQQKIIYNRRVHDMFRTLRKMFYDQPQVWRKLSENCTADGHALPKEQQKDGNFSDKACGILLKAFNDRRDNFEKETFVGTYEGLALNETLRQYLEKLDKLCGIGQPGNPGFCDEDKLAELAKLDPRELEAMQRAALEYYNKYQLEMMQKMVIVELTSYFSQMTNTKPKEDKEDAAVDATMKPMGDLSGLLDQFEKGDLDGYSAIMKAAGWTDIDPKNSKYIAPEMLAVASEAFADVSYAVKAKKRLLEASTNEEKDAAIEEAQQWLKLAQIQLQAFEMHTLVYQIERLRDDQLSEGMGLPDPDLIKDPVEKKRAQDMRARVNDLVAQATGQGGYLDELHDQTKKTKDLLLRQAIAQFYMTFQNASIAYYYDETFQERLRLLAAKAGEIKTLYEALAFEKYRDQYMGGSVQGQLVDAKAYLTFLSDVEKGANGLGFIKRNCEDLDRLAAQLKQLLNVPDIVAAREKLRGLDSLYKDIVKRLGYDQMPDLDKVKKDAQEQSIGQAKALAAVQHFSADLRTFDMVNELDIYVKNYASSQEIKTKNEGTMSKMMKWISGLFNTGGYHDEAIGVALDKLPWTKEAFEKLGQHPEQRQKVLDLLAQGRFVEALKLICDLDPDAAKQAWSEYLSDKAKDDPFDSLDFDSFVNKGTDDQLQVEAQGAMGHLFKLLSPLMIGYNAVSAAVDAAIMTVATAGLSFVAGNVMTLVKGAATTLRVAEVMRAIQAIEAVQKVMSVLSKIAEFVKSIPIVGRIPVLISKIVAAGFRSAATTLRLPLLKEGLTLQESTSLVKASFSARNGLSLLKAAATFQAMNVGIMGVASGGTAVLGQAWHQWRGTPGQFGSYGEAFVQGTAGGAAFGAKASLFTIFAPVPATAFEGVAGGTLIKGIAETSGPIGAVTSFSAKMALQAGSTVGGSLAEKGLLGSIMTSKVFVAMVDIPAVGTLAKTAVFGGSLFDGALKYMMLTTGAQEIAQTGSYLYNKVLGTYQKEDPTGQGVNGATPEMRNLSQSYSFSLAVAEASWIFMPSNHMERPEDRQAANDSQLAFRTIAATEGYDRIYDAQNEDIIHWTKPWYQRTLTEVISGQKVWDYKVTNADRSEAEKRVAPKKSMAENLAVVVEDPERHGQILKVDAMVDNLGRDKPADFDSGAAAERAPPADAESFTSVVDARPEEKTGSTKPLLYGPDGRPLNGSEPARKVQLVDQFGNPLRSEPRAAESAKPVEASRVILDASGEPIDDGKVKPGEMRYTLESVEVNRDELIRKLRKDDALRLKIISAEGEVAIPGKNGEVMVRGKALSALQEIAQQAHVEQMSVWGKLLVSSPAGFIRESTGRAKDVVLDRKLETRYELFKRRIVEKVTGQTADEIMSSAVTQVDRFIGSRSAQDQLVLGKMRNTLIRQVMVEAANAREMDLAGGSLTRWWLNTRKLFTDAPVELTAAQKGQIDAIIRVYQDGVFGQRLMERGPNGKLRFDAKGEPVWKAGASKADAFTDRQGHIIPGFRDAQVEVLRAFLEGNARGDYLQFASMPTSGGKTLIGSIVADRMHQNALAEGRRGAVYLTTTPELVQQFKNDYRAFNNGRDPSFEVMTYEDFMARMTTAKARGAASPFLEYDIVCDEFDKLAMGTPLSLGQFKGELSFPKVDPFQKAIREAVVDGGEISKLYQEYGGGQAMQPGAFQDLLQTNPEFRGKFETLIDNVSRKAENGLAYAKTDAFRESIDPTLYPDFLKRFERNPGTQWSQEAQEAARRQIQIAMLREHKEAFGGGLTVGNIERQHGDVKGWVRKILSGAYMLESHPDKTKVFMDDPTRQRILQLSNDVPFSSLDTPHRAAAEILKSTPLTLDFETVAVTNFRDLIAQAKMSNARVFALSGTCADPIRDVLINEFGFKFSGELTVARQHQIVRPTAGETDLDMAVRMGLENYQAERAKGRKGTTYLWVDSLAQLDKLREVAKRRGVKDDQIALMVYPSSNLKENERWMQEVKSERNKLAFEKGDVVLTVMVGAGGFRGLSNKHDAYKGGRIITIATNPQTLPLSEGVQFDGRTAPGRTQGVETEYFWTFDPTKVFADRNYSEALNRLSARLPSLGDAALAEGSWQKLLDGKSEPAAQVKAGLADIANNPERIAEKELLAQILTVGRADGIKELDQAKAYELLLRLKDPNEIGVTSVYNDRVAAFKLREAIGSRLPEFKGAQGKAKLDALLRDPKSDPAGAEILITTMQQIAEEQAISSSGIIRQMRAQLPAAPGLGAAPVAPQPPQPAVVR